MLLWVNRGIRCVVQATALKKFEPGTINNSGPNWRQLLIISGQI